MPTWEVLTRRDDGEGLPAGRRCWAGSMAVAFRHTLWRELCQSRLHNLTLRAKKFCLMCQLRLLAFVLEFGEADSGVSKPV